MEKRQSWDRFFMDLAYKFSTRSTCDRKHVGCVIVSNDKHVIATGYNGSMPGLEHCDDVGHWMIEGRSGCQRTSHAEASAISQAARYGHSIKGATAYVTVSPCIVCAKLLIMSGVTRVVFDEKYREDYSGVLFEDANVDCLELQDYNR